MKERSYTVSILIVSFFMVFFVSACGGNMDDKKDTLHWTEDFNLWYEWKIKDTNLTQEQKIVIADIEKINDIFSKVEALSLTKDATIIQRHIKELDQLHVNKLCVVYKSYVIDKAKLLILKKETKEKNEIASKLFVEFFKILKEIKLIDNYDADMTKLKQEK